MKTHLLLGVTVVFGSLAVASQASAKRTGMNLPCHNCHEGQDKPKITAVLSAARVEPGQSVTLTITAQHERAKVGGVLLDSKGAGSIELVDPVGTHLFDMSTTQATHTMPQMYQNGQVQFSFRWVAPAMTGAYPFEVWSNAGNDNLMPMDDSPAEVLTGVSVGCDAAWYYIDSDQDGAGAEKEKIFSCEVVPDRVLVGGDCNDKDPAVSPSAVEVCNSIDDNCDGTADEGFTPTLLVVDADGDGFGARGGMSLIGCPPLPGYAPSFDDCNDADASINPGAAEVANGRDDNCNGKTDDVTAAEPAAPPPSDGGGGCALSARSHVPVLHAASGALFSAWWLGRRLRRRRVS